VAYGEKVPVVVGVCIVVTNLLSVLSVGVVSVVVVNSVVVAATVVVVSALDWPK